MSLDGESTRCQARGNGGDIDDTGRVKIVRILGQSVCQTRDKERKIRKRHGPFELEYKRCGHY